MRELVIKRAANLLSVKALVTLALTGVFAYMAVYAVVIAFYFGTQSQKMQETLDATNGTDHG